MLIRRLRGVLRGFAKVQLSSHRVHRVETSDEGSSRLLLAFVRLRLTLFVEQEPATETARSRAQYLSLMTAKIYISTTEQQDQIGDFQLEESFCIPESCNTDADLAGTLSIFCVYSYLAIY